MYNFNTKSNTVKVLREYFQKFNPKELIYYFENYLSLLNKLLGLF